MATFNKQAEEIKDEMEASEGSFRERMAERLKRRKEMREQIEKARSDEELIVLYCDFWEALGEDEEQLRNLKRSLEKAQKEEAAFLVQEIEKQISPLRDRIGDMKKDGIGMLKDSGEGISEAAIPHLSLRMEVRKLHSQLKLNRFPAPENDLAGSKTAFDSLLQKARNLSVIVSAEPETEDSFSWRNPGEGNRVNHFAAAKMVGHDSVLGEFYKALVDYCWKIRDQETEAHNKRRSAASQFLVTPKGKEGLVITFFHQFPGLVKGEIAGQYWLRVEGKLFGQDHKVIKEKHFFGHVFLTAEPIKDGTGAKISFVGADTVELCEEIFRKHTGKGAEWLEEDIVCIIRDGDISGVHNTLLRNSLQRALRKAEDFCKKIQRQDNFVSWRKLEDPIAWADLVCGKKGVWPFSVSGWADSDKKEHRVTGRFVSDGKMFVAELLDGGDSRRKLGLEFIPGPREKSEISRLRTESRFKALAYKNEGFEADWCCQRLAENHKADEATAGTNAAILALKGDGTVEPREGTIAVSCRVRLEAFHAIGFLIQRTGNKITFLEGATAVSEKMMEGLMKKPLPLDKLPDDARKFLRGVWIRSQGFRKEQEQYVPDHLKFTKGKDQRAKAKSSDKSEK